MLETMLVGALMLYASVLVHYFRPTSLTCLLVPWLRELGFSIFYGSILIKLYKILAEFQTRKAHRVCLRDKDQVVYLLAVVLIVVGYMSAWTALMIDGFFVGRRSSHLSAVNSSSTGESPINEALIGGAHEQDNDAARVRHQTAALPTLGAFNYLAHGLSSFGELFSGLLESERQYDAQNDILIYFTRCRKLTWDYVTESSESHDYSSKLLLSCKASEANLCILWLYRQDGRPHRPKKGRGADYDVADKAHCVGLSVGARLDGLLLAPKLPPEHDETRRAGKRPPPAVVVAGASSGE